MHISFFFFFPFVPYCLWNIHVCNLNKTFQQSRGPVPQTRWARGDWQTRTQPTLQRTLLAPQPLNVKREKRRMRHQLQLAVLLLGSTGIWIAQLVLQVGHFLQKTNTSTKKKKVGNTSVSFSFLLSSLPLHHQLLCWTAQKVYSLFLFKPPPKYINTHAWRQRNPVKLFCCLNKSQTFAKQPDQVRSEVCSTASALNNW